MSSAAICRYPVPGLDELPEDIRTRILEVQQKAGFVPNVFIALARRPLEFRAFFAYHDALMLRDSGLSETQLARVRTPIGLDLGGEAASDIALSIMSEVVAVMHGRSGAPLSTKKREAVLQPT